MSSITSAPQTKRRTPAAPAGRLPVPTRDRRPALAALAVLLIVGGALVSGLIALRSGERVDHLMLNRSIPAGQAITSNDVSTVALAGGEAAGLLPAGAKLGGYAVTSLPKGTLLTAAMVEPTRSLPENSAVVGLDLASGQSPAGGVAPGDIVQVLQVPTRGDDTAPVVLVKAAVVVPQEGQVAASGDSGGNAVVDTSNGITISVVVPRDDAADVAAASSSGAVAVVKLPAGTKTTVG